MEILFYPHPNSDKVIAAKFCSWPDSSAVEACAKLFCHMISSNWVTAKRIFYRIWSLMETSLVKWFPGPCTLYAINILKLRQNRQHCVDNIFKCSLLNDRVWISVENSSYKGLIVCIGWGNDIMPKVPEPMLTRISEARLLQYVIMTWEFNV